MKFIKPKHRKIVEPQASYIMVSLTLPTYYLTRYYHEKSVYFSSQAIFIFYYWFRGSCVRAVALVIGSFVARFWKRARCKNRDFYRFWLLFHVRAPTSLNFIIEKFASSLTISLNLFATPSTWPLSWNNTNISKIDLIYELWAALKETISLKYQSYTLSLRQRPAAEQFRPTQPLYPLSTTTK